MSSKGAQKSGHLYKRAASSSSWQQRYVTLMIETGMMKFYAEKSGKRTAKGQVNIKKGVLSLLSQSEVGKVFAFKLEMEELGSSDEACQFLAADDKEQFDSWIEAIAQCCNDGVIPSPPNEEIKLPVPSQEGNAAPVVAEVVQHEDTVNKPPEKKVETSTNRLKSKRLSMLKAKSKSHSSENIAKPAEISSTKVKETAPVIAEEAHVAVNESGESTPVKVDEKMDTPAEVSPIAEESALHIPSAESIGTLTPLPSSDEQRDEVNNENMTPPPLAPGSGKLRSVESEYSIASHTDTSIDSKVSRDASHHEELYALDRAKSKISAQNSLDVDEEEDVDDNEEVEETPVGGVAERVSTSDNSAVTPIVDAPIKLEQPIPKSAHFSSTKLFESLNNDSAAESASVDERAPTFVSDASETDDVDDKTMQSEEVTNPNLKKLEEKLESARKSFSAPKFKGLLNENGASPATFRKSLSKASSPALSTNGDAEKVEKVGKSSKKSSKKNRSRSATPTGGIPGLESKTPRRSIRKTLPIEKRPTEPVRKGYLYKLDTSSKDVTEDSWMTQFVTLDINTGILTYFAEIHGKQIQRGKFSIPQCSIKTIDTVFNGRLWAFKLSFRPPSVPTEGSSGDSPDVKKVSATFAAEDEATLSYWMMAIEDADKAYEDSRSKLENEKGRQAGIAALTEGDDDDKPQNSTVKPVPPTNPLAAAAAEVVSRRNSKLAEANDSVIEAPKEKSSPAIQRPHRESSSTFKPFHVPHGSALALDTLSNDSDVPQQSSPTKKIAKSLSKQTSFHFQKTEGSSRATPIPKSDQRENKDDDDDEDLHITASGDDAILDLGKPVSAEALKNALKNKHFSASRDESFTYDDAYKENNLTTDDSQEFFSGGLNRSDTAEIDMTAVYGSPLKTASQALLTAGSTEESIAALLEGQSAHEAADIANSINKAPLMIPSQSGDDSLFAVNPIGRQHSKLDNPASAPKESVSTLVKGSNPEDSLTPLSAPPVMESANSIGALAAAAAAKRRSNASISNESLTLTSASNELLPSSTGRGRISQQASLDFSVANLVDIDNLDASLGLQNSVSKSVSGAVEYPSPVETVAQDAAVNAAIERAKAAQADVPPKNSQLQSAILAGEHSKPKSSAAPPNLMTPAHAAAAAAASRNPNSTSVAAAFSFISPVDTPTAAGTAAQPALPQITEHVVNPLPNSSVTQPVANTLPISQANSITSIPPPPPVDNGPPVFIIEEALKTTNPIDVEIPKLKLEIKSLKYPAERLARRIKIWYCSSGFSLSSEQEIKQFVRELKNTGDPVLESFSEEKFGNILDWANLLELLRKYEQHKLIDESSAGNSGSDSSVNPSSNIVFDLTANLPSRKQPAVHMDLDDHMNIDAIAATLSEKLGITKNILSKQLPSMLNGEGKPLSHGMGLLKDELTFAEDLILYQEEVIDHLWDSYSTLKTLVEQKDDVINQLYSQISELQEKVDNFAKAPPIPNPSVANKFTSNANTWNESSTNTPRTGKYRSESEALQIASLKDELKKVTDEKQAQARANTEAKFNLKKEIEVLKKAMSPRAEELLNDLRKAEEQKTRIEAELVNSHILNDELKNELERLRIKLQETEMEKSMLENEFLMSKNNPEIANSNSSNPEDERKSNSPDESNESIATSSNLPNSDTTLPRQQIPFQNSEHKVNVDEHKVNVDELGSSQELKEEDLRDLNDVSKQFLKRQPLNAAIVDATSGNSRSDNDALLHMASPTELHEPSDDNLDHHRPHSQDFRMPLDTQPAPIGGLPVHEPYISVQNYFPQAHSPPPVKPQNTKVKPISSRVRTQSGGNQGGTNSKNAGLPSYMQPTQNRMRSLSPSGRVHTHGTGEHPDDPGSPNNPQNQRQRQQYFYNDMDTPNRGPTTVKQDADMVAFAPAQKKQPMSVPFHIHASPLNAQSKNSYYEHPSNRDLNQFDPMGNIDPLEQMYGFNHEVQVPRSEQASDNPLRNMLRGEKYKKLPGKSSASNPLPPAHRAAAAAGRPHRLSGISPPRSRPPAAVVPTGYDGLNAKGEPVSVRMGQQAIAAAGTRHGGSRNASHFMTNTSSRNSKLQERDKPRLPTDFLGAQRNTGRFHTHN